MTAPGWTHTVVGCDRFGHVTTTVTAKLDGAGRVVAASCGLVGGCTHEQFVEVQRWWRWAVALPGVEAGRLFFGRQFGPDVTLDGLLEAGAVRLFPN